MDREIVEHYERGVELERLEGGASRIEFARTKELLERTLPAPPATIADVGGGPGRYAAWLADLGYAVELVDPVPLHVETARARSASSSRSFGVRLGDARSLPFDDATFDAVLLLGPLYHLTEREERIRALAEARRAARGGGVIAVAVISRFASLLDGMMRSALTDPAFAAIVERDLIDGQHRNPTGDDDLFTTAYFHDPSDVLPELEAAGIEPVALFGIEGPGHLVADRWDDAAGRESILRAARAIEREPSTLGVSNHLLAVGRV